MADRVSRPAARRGTDRGRLWRCDAAVLLREESWSRSDDTSCGRCGVHPRACSSAVSLTSVPKIWIPAAGTDSPKYSKRAMATEYLLATRTSRHPESEQLFTRQAFAHDWKHVSAQRVEGVRIAEELRHANQEILVQGGQFTRIVINQSAVSSTPSIRPGVPCAARADATWSFVCNA